MMYLNPQTVASFLNYFPQWMRQTASQQVPMQLWANNPMLSTQGQSNPSMLYNPNQGYSNPAPVMQYANGDRVQHYAPVNQKQSVSMGLDQMSMSFGSSISSNFSD